MLLSPSLSLRKFFFLNEGVGHVPQHVCGGQGTLCNDSLPPFQGIWGWDSRQVPLPTELSPRRPEFSADSLSSFTLPGSKRALAISGNHAVSRLEHANQLGISNATPLILAGARKVPGGPVLKKEARVPGAPPGLLETCYRALPSLPGSPVRRSFCCPLLPPTQ